MENKQNFEFNYKEVKKQRLLLAVIYALAIGSLWLPWIEHDFGFNIGTTTHAFLDDGAYVIVLVAAIAILVSVFVGGMKNEMNMVAKAISAVIGVIGVVVTFVVIDDIDFGSTTAAWGAYVTMATFILGILSSFLPSSVIEKLIPFDLGEALDNLADEDADAMVYDVEKSPAEQVQELKELLDSGALTQEEFDIKKKEILGL